MHIHWTAQSRLLPACHHFSLADFPVPKLCIDLGPHAKSFLRSKASSASSGASQDAALQQAISTASNVSGAAPPQQDGGVSQSGHEPHTFYIFIIQEPEGLQGGLSPEASSTDDCNTSWSEEGHTSSTTSSRNMCRDGRNSSIIGSSISGLCEDSGAAARGSRGNDANCEREGADVGRLSHVVTMGQYRHAWTHVPHWMGWREVVEAARGAAMELVPQLFSTGGCENDLNNSRPKMLPSYPPHT